MLIVQDSSTDREYQNDEEPVKQSPDSMHILEFEEFVPTESEIPPTTNQESKFQVQNEE